ncbi:hypothetical protein [uncultured Psychroserpens sp.]|uniref:hypothetical protein n=1 Tax=uncultured Psychroserpens sp. TaxID=255436 RepID=UPI002617618E|nr:hypothetical protein [uncultured Psychroserpens sp.]
MTQIKSLVPKNIKKQKEDMAKNLSVLAFIRGYVLGVEHTQIHAIDPKPSWYDELSKHLDAAKKHVAPWQTTVEPGITSHFPHSISNMASRFGTGTDQILDILNKTTPDGKQYVPNAGEIETIVESLNWISKHIGAESDALAAVKKDFDTFKANSDTDNKALTSGVNSIQKAILDDQNLIIGLQGDIATDNANIAADQAAITASGIAAGVGLFVGVSVLGLGAAASGPAAPIAMVIGGLIMAAAAIQFAAVLAVYIPKLNAARKKLAADTQHLNEEKQQVASLVILNNSIGKLVDLNTQMQNSLQDLTDWFSNTAESISTVATQIEEASSDLTNKEWFDLKLDVIQAQKDWSQLETYANQWAVAATTIVNKVISINKDDSGSSEAA